MSEVIAVSRPSGWPAAAGPGPWHAQCLTARRPNLLVAGIAASAAADAPMAVLGVSDPSSWAARDWVSDAVPHVAYRLVTAAVIQRLDRG